MKKTLTPEIALLEYNKNKSTREIAEEFGVSKTTVRNMLLKAGKRLRSNSESQKVAFQTGRKKKDFSPRTEEEKIKLSEAISQYWANMPENEREARRKAGKEQWEAKSPSEKEALLKAARDAARDAIDKGSKLEIAIKEALEEDGLKVEWHKDDLIDNPRLQVDLFVPLIFTVIEVDGRSHFDPIWNRENYERNVRADQEKNGLLLLKGFNVIRVQANTDHLSKKNIRDAIDAVRRNVNRIKKNNIQKDLTTIKV
jgi:very-short-patch-repair endonuclease